MALAARARDHRPAQEAAWANLLVTPKRRPGLGVTLAQPARRQHPHHGPGQWVLYPIVHLQPGELDIGRFVCNLEAMMYVCRAYNLTPQRSEGETGTWIGDQKIGAIGTRFGRWVSSHVAFNGRTILEDFKLIVPCGIVDKGVCSLESLGVDHDLERLGEELAQAVAQRLGQALIAGPDQLPPNRSV